jgi:hypothetical protein
MVHRLIELSIRQKDYTTTQTDKTMSEKTLRLQVPRRHYSRKPRLAMRILCPGEPMV